MTTVEGWEKGKIVVSNIGKMVIALCNQHLSKISDYVVYSGKALCDVYV